MIKLTRLDGHEYFLNCDWIECFESTPDTVITLVSGKKMIVKQSVETVHNLIVTYKQSIHHRPFQREGKRVRVLAEDRPPYLLDKLKKDAENFKIPEQEETDDFEEDTFE